MKVNIGPLLRKYSHLPASVEADGKTVGECLDDLVRQYPESREWLFNRSGLLSAVISINNAEIVTPDREGLGRILKVGDELQIFVAISGG